MDSSLVILRKKNSDLHISGDYKIGLNHKICADSYSIHYIEWALNFLIGMKTFSKTDLKSAYHQIAIDEDFKEVATIKTPIGLLR